MERHILAVHWENVAHFKRDESIFNKLYIRIKDVGNLKCNKINMGRKVKKQKKYFTTYLIKSYYAKIDEDLIEIDLICNRILLYR